MELNLLMVSVGHFFLLLYFLNDEAGDEHFSQGLPHNQNASAIRAIRC